MTRGEILELVRSHLASELEIEPERVEESTRFKEDIDADSLDLVTLVMELEDTYGVRIPDEEAARIVSVGQAVDYILAHAPQAAR
jgi:acyl carrier protein